jgi:hypothetical protein
MRMVRRIGLYIGLVVVAVVVSVAAALGAIALGIPSDTARWIGLGAFLVCVGVIVYFMEFQRS